MGGNDVLYLFFQEPRALSPRQRSRCENAEEVLGRSLLRKIFKKGHSLNTFNVALMVTKYCDQDTKFLRKVTAHCMAHGVHPLRNAVTLGTSISVIMKAINSNKPLVTGYSSEE
jgi:hypothetical protein